MSPWRVAMAVTATVAMLGAACASKAPDGSTPSRTEDLAAALGGLCQAAGLARSGDLGAARATFQDESHAYLHRLAREVGEEDPTASGALLEAKQRVESALDPERGEGSEEVAALLTKLEAAAREAAAEVGLREERCGGRAG